RNKRAAVRKKDEARHFLSRDQHRADGVVVLLRMQSTPLPGGKRIKEKVACWCGCHRSYRYHTRKEKKTIWFAEMIESWLTAISAIAPGEPASAAASARAAIPFLTWETIERLLDADARPDMLVVRNAN